MPRESLVELYDSPGMARDATSSGAMCRAILDQAPTLLLLLDAGGGVQYCNRRAQTLLGISTTEITDAPIARFIVAEDCAEFREQLRLLVAGGEGAERRCELRFLDHEGTGVAVDCTFLNLLAQPDVHAVLLSARELSEYKAMEQRLLTTSNERLHAVTQSVPDLLFLADLDLRIQFANRAMLGHSPDELVGRSILDLLPDEERAPI